MKLSIFLPFCKLLEIDNVTKIQFETKTGNYGILPNRLDFTAAVIPGILYYESSNQDHWIAIDEGIVIKANEDIMVSVHDAVEADTLEELESVIEKEFLLLDKNEQLIRISIAKLEGNYFQRLKEMHYV